MVHQRCSVHPFAVIFWLARVETHRFSQCAHRYVSIVLLAISNIGWFYHGFSPEACSKYYLVAPVFKGEALGIQLHPTLTPFSVIQIIISQIIAGYQTWNISQRSREMGIFLLALGFVIAALETFSNFDSRIPVQKSGK